MTGLTIGSLFSGYLGLDMAAEAVFGARTVWTSDIDPGACKIINHRYPNLPNHGDITGIDWTAVEPVDILTGGYPCQPFSAAGQRKGTDDARHLWPFVVEALSYLRPRIAVFENVRGHLTLGFDHVLRDLQILGYDVQWCLLRAADVGAPHGRARIFILATDGQLRRRPDRWRGVHRHSGVGRIVPDPAQGGNDGQGAAGAVPDAGDVRRQDRERSGGYRSAPRDVRMAADRNCCGQGDPQGPAPAVREGSGGDDRPAISGDGRCCATTAERPSDLDGGHADASCGVPQPDTGSESSRSGSGACCAAGGGADSGDLQFGHLVGSSGRPVWPSRVRGSVPEFRSDDQRQDLRGAVGLLPTPTACDWKDGRRVNGVIWNLLPTPAAMNPNDGESFATWEERRQRTQERVQNGNGFGTPLSIAVQPEAGMFGQYADAIARWQPIIGRPAPDPTTNGRLSPLFVEWMMGLPEGWVTDVPNMRRAEQLKALGNGVVPQQASAALEHMINTQAVAA